MINRSGWEQAYQQQSHWIATEGAATLRLARALFRTYHYGELVHHWASPKT